jgi:hypothetical protein
MAAGRLYDALVARYGAASVFRDKEAIRPGYDWVEEIENALAGDVVVLALLGPSWADVRDAEGRRRLDDPHDPNRLELEIALQKKTPLIPVLVEAADIPEQLPPSLMPLTRRHAVRLRDDDWDGDFMRLTDALESLGLTAPVDAKPSRVTRPQTSPMTTRLAAAAVAVIAVLTIALWVKANATSDVPPPDEKNSSNPAPSPYSNFSDPKREPLPAPAPAPLPTLAGTWRDETYPNVVDQISQEGPRFRFVRRGLLPNGAYFESVGEGRVDGTYVSHQYQTQYQGGGFSAGECSGNLTSDGSRVVMQCSDSLLGLFPVVMVRQ